MNSKTLYMLFVHAVKHPQDYVDAGEITRLRSLVQDVTGIYSKMPDKVLADVLRRKVFSEKLIIPNDKLEKCEREVMDIFGENYEELFKL